MWRFVWWLGAAVWAALVATSVSGDCVFKGSCKPGTFGSQPCAVSGKDRQPRSLTSAHTFAELRERCAEFVDPHEKLCCDDDQAAEFAASFKTVQGLLGGCPSCYRNLARIFCRLTCAPNQHEFVKITNTTKVPPTTYGDLSVAAVEYYLAEDYIVNTYDSCAEVKDSQSGLAVRVLCGPYGIHCSAYNLLKNMGTAPIPSPFTIDFKFWATPPYKVMNHSTLKCSDAPRGSSACTCSDCVATCPPYPLPSPAKDFKIFGFDGWYVIVAIVFSLFVVAIVSLRVVQILQKTRSPSLTAKDDREVSSSRNISSISRGTPLVRAFETLGFVCSRFPWFVITTGLVVCGLCALGNFHFTVMTDPVQLWSAPSAVSRQQRNYYNEHLGPFYRVEQVIVLNEGGQAFNYSSNATGMTYEFSPIFERSFFLDVLALQNNISSLKGKLSSGREVGLDDICFSPMNKSCAIQSAANWFQSNGTLVESSGSMYFDHIIDCINSPLLIPSTDSGLHVGCLGVYGGPSYSYVALGGYNGTDALQARALVLTFLVNNHVDEDQNQRAVAWERSFVDYLKNFTHPNMSIAFLSENSIQDELQRGSRSDILTIALSYLAMFVYVSLSLGRYRSWSTLFVDSHIVLGIMGVLLVLLSVAASIGLFSFVGVPSTLIIFEVIPFLVLAIGVDNIFILVQAYQRTARLDDEDVDEHIARVLGMVGPSMLLASAAECTCFFLGAMSSMPAVRLFALYAALALLVDFLLQITVFVALLSLDARRRDARRIDLFCCFTAKRESLENTNEDSDEPDNDESTDSWVGRFIDAYYVPLLRSPTYRHFLIVAFVAYFCVSAAVVHKLDVGLDQGLSMPTDSYLQQYFRYLRKYLNVGPPVYFVVKDGYNYTEPRDQDLLGSYVGASPQSLVNEVHQASLSPNVTSIAASAMSWIDDYFTWTATCCLENPDTHERCYKPDHNCKRCPANETNGRPVDFYQHIRDFLRENPDEACPSAGHAAYSNAVELRSVNSSSSPGRHEVEIGSTSFMSYHSVMRTGDDFVNALKMSRYVAGRIQDNIRKNYVGGGDDDDHSDNVEVFAYSVFYVYYEQYLTIWLDTATQLLLSFSGVFIITFLLMKLRIVPTVTICATILMIVVDLMGVMYFFGISLNAVSLVNLVMCVGISVEFCSHITKAFVDSMPASSSMDRATVAVVTTGRSVFSGITMTKFAGVVVLAWAKSQLFVVFYFRMYLAIVLLGSAHGLLFLPALLASFPTSTRKRGCSSAST